MEDKACAIILFHATLYFNGQGAESACNTKKSSSPVGTAPIPFMEVRCLVQLHVKKGLISNPLIALSVWAERLSPSVLSSLELYLATESLHNREIFGELLREPPGAIRFSVFQGAMVCPEHSKSVRPVTMSSFFKSGSTRVHRRHCRCSSLTAIS